jgi:putative DNA primase/helicase
LFICHGTGANGKSTFLTTLQKLMGPYGCQSPVEVLMRRTKNGPDPEVARLKGMRLVVSSETDEGQQFSEATIKQLTGGDKLVARHLYQEPIEFMPQHKIIISANHLPEISGSDHAIWRRIRVIPFLRRFDKDMDTTLPDKLEKELEGILAWAVRGCLLWQEAGLHSPDTMKRAEKAYREDMDHVEGWLRERYERDPQAWVPFKALHDDYSTWQKETGSRPMGTKQLAQALKEKGMTPHKCPQGRGYLGLKPKGWEVM